MQEPDEWSRMTDAGKAEVTAMINSASSLKMLAVVESIAHSLRTITIFAAFIAPFLVIRLFLSILKS